MRPFDGWSRMKFNVDESLDLQEISVSYNMTDY